VNAAACNHFHYCTCLEDSVTNALVNFTAKLNHTRNATTATLTTTSARLDVPAFYLGAEGL
jgi:hypothetical protein